MNFITKLFNKKQVDYTESAYPEIYYCGYEIEVKFGEHTKKIFWTRDNITSEEYTECYENVDEKIKEAQKKLEAAVRNGDTFVTVGTNLIRVSDFIDMRMVFGNMKNKP
jgi:hypothetical protein